MSFFIIGGLALSAYAAKSQYEAGKQQQYDLEAQAEQEELQSESEEIVRRKRLNKVLAANVASATGNMEGSGQAIALSSARNASSSEGAASLSDRLRQDLLKREGKASAAAGRTQAASTLLSGAAQMSQLRAGKNAKKD